jgi:hypothetical protein
VVRARTPRGPSWSGRRVTTLPTSPVEVAPGMTAGCPPCPARCSISTAPNPWPGSWRHSMRGHRSRPTGGGSRSAAEQQVDTGARWSLPATGRVSAAVTWTSPSPSAWSSWSLGRLEGYVAARTRGRQPVNRAGNVPGRFRSPRRTSGRGRAADHATRRRNCLTACDGENDRWVQITHSCPMGVARTPAKAIRCSSGAQRTRRGDPGGSGTGSRARPGGSRSSCHSATSHRVTSATP